MKNTDERKMRAEELTKRRMILEQRGDHLKEMKKKSRPQPVTSEQAEPKCENIVQLLEVLNNLPFVPLDLSKCKVIIPPVVVEKKMTLMIMLKNKNNNPIIGASKDINVLIEKTKGDEAIQVEPIGEVGSGRYEASFTVSSCGYYMISIIVDGHHIPGSPYMQECKYVCKKLCVMYCTYVSSECLL